MSKYNTLSPFGSCLLVIGQKCILHYFLFKWITGKREQMVANISTNPPETSQKPAHFFTDHLK